jgi:hypothetical protein
VAAFVIGTGVGFARVSPVLPDAVSDEFAALLAGGGSVILVGVGAFAVLMVLLVGFYHFYL